MSWYFESALSLFFVVIIVALAAWLSSLARRAPRPRLGWPALWRLACLIGAVRIGALWVGNAAYRDSGWSQGLGYFLLMTGLPEIYFARSARADALRWLLLGSALLAGSSLVWAGLLVWVANRVRPAETR
jgi:hypothetical protein